MHKLFCSFSVIIQSTGAFLRGKRSGRQNTLRTFSAKTEYFRSSNLSINDALAKICIDAAKKCLSNGFRTVFEHKTCTKTTFGKTCQCARLRQLPLADLSNGPWIRSRVRAGYLPALIVRKLVVHKTWQYNVFLSFSFHFGDKIGVIPSSKLIVRH